VFFFLCLVAFLPAADAPAPIFSQSFDQLPEGKPPEDLLILAGNFHIQSIDNNKILALDPNPLDSFGLIFGPAEHSSYTISLRVRASNTAKRFPEFGVGAPGPGGYKLWLMPATNQLQLKNADNLLTHVPYQWTSGQWTRLKFQITKTADNKTQLQGKAWPDGQPEPKEWLISAQSNQPPKPGKAVLWATPYSGTPTYFDDLQITPAQ
jgi:hypothetical protein